MIISITLLIGSLLKLIGIVIPDVISNLYVDML